MIIAEFFIEIFGESFLNLTSAFTPDKKVSDKTKKAVTVIAAVTGFISMVCFFTGFVLLDEESGKYSTAGIVCICIFAVYLIMVIAANIIRLIKKHNSKK